MNENGYFEKGRGRSFVRKRELKRNVKTNVDENSIWR